MKNNFKGKYKYKIYQHEGIYDFDGYMKPK